MSTKKKKERKRKTLTPREPQESEPATKEGKTDAN